MKDFKVPLQYGKTCEIDNKLYFFNMLFNGLFSINLENYSVQCVFQIPFLDDLSFAPYVHLCSYNKKILLFPNSGESILIYDTENNIYQQLFITIKDVPYNYTTAGVVQLGDKVWVFPHNLNQGILILDLLSFQLQRDFEFEKIFKDYEEILWLGKLYRDKTTFLLKNNTIIEVDITKKIILLKKDFDKKINIYTTRCDGIDYWILQKASTNVYKWSKLEDKLEEYQLSKAEWITNEGIPYSNIIFVRDMVILLNNRLKYMMQIDKKHNLIKEMKIYPENFRFLLIPFLERWEAFSAFDLIDNKIIIHPVIGNMLLIYDIEKNCMEGKELCVTTKQFPFLKKLVYQVFSGKDNIYFEKDSFGALNKYIFISDDNEKININNYLGVKIYNSLKSI